jgi:hypothetical protein
MDSQTRKSTHFSMRVISRPFFENTVSRRRTFNHTERPPDSPRLCEEVGIDPEGAADYLQATVRGVDRLFRLGWSEG